MTHPFPDGNPAPRPLSPAAPPPFSGTAPDLGLPAPTAPWYPGDPTAAPPPHSVYQPIGNLPVPAPPYPGYQPMSQQTGPRLVSPGGRLGAALIDGLLILLGRIALPWARTMPRRRGRVFMPEQVAGGAA